MNLLPFALVAGVFWLCSRHPRRNPSALEDSMIFHGKREVRGGKMVIGKIESITYEAPPGSRRAGQWQHRFGDGGRFALSSKEKPLLVEKNGRIAIEQAKSPARFDSRYGILR